MSLRAPLAVPVEIRAGKRRVFRLSEAAGEDGLRLRIAAPFEPGRPVEIAFVLPDDPGPPLTLRATLGVVDEDDADEITAGGRELTLLDPPDADRIRLWAYVKARLALPD